MSLDTIVEKSYRIFERYKIGKTLAVCKACCVTDEEEKELVNAPLREISRNLLQNSYYESARNFSTEELGEMKHFLPRVMALVADFEFPCHSVEITFTRLDLDQPEKWNQDEIDVLTDFSLEYFRKCLVIYPLPNGLQLVDVLIMFGIGHFDLKLILNEWTKASSKESVLHLKDLILDEIEDPVHKPLKLINPFSTKVVSDTVVNWLNNPGVKQHLLTQIENVLMKHRNEFDEETIEQLNWTYELMKK